MFEGLEQRRLFTFTIDANGVLNVEGSGGADTMYASWNSNGSSSTMRISDGDTARNYTIATSGINAVYFYGKSGTDTIQARRIQTGYGTYSALLPVLVNAGADNDTVTGSDARDVVFGGSSNDRIELYGGNDDAYGEGGNDSIDGGDGSDYIEGGDGADVLAAGRTNNVAFSGDQIDGDVDYLFGNGQGLGSDGDTDTPYYLNLAEGDSGVES